MKGCVLLLLMCLIAGHQASNCADTWGSCSLVMSNYGGCYSAQYGSYMKTHCQGSCPQFCPQPCQWGSWNEGSCDKTCGGGVRRDTRNKLVQEQNGGYCPDGAYRVQDCNQQQCPTCAREQGYCVTSRGKDRNSGVKKLDSGDGNNKNRQEQCLKKCRSVAGVTGCELIWNTANRMEDRFFGLFGGLFGGGRKPGCYAHTREVARGNGAGNHFCWPCSDL